MPIALKQGLKNAWAQKNSLGPLKGCLCNGKWYY